MPSNSFDRPLVLITRPQPEADDLAERLRSKGIGVAMAPLFTIKPARLGPLPQANALLLTSPRAARYLPAGVQDMPTYALGEATAEAAKRAGLNVVAQGAGSSDTLPLHHLPQDTAVLHLSGDAIARDLAPVFQSLAIPYHRVVTYMAESAEELPATAGSFLLDGGPKIVTLFSVRAAQVFAQLVAAAGLDDRLTSVTAACFGPRIARAARQSLPYRSVRESEAGNVTGFVDFVSSGAS
ncbi:MAG: uroporphyrinogen-III synthase [Pseudomonadota bacterium]